MFQTYRRTIRRSLRNELTITLTVEAPSMIHTLQPPPLINPPVRQGSKAMRTRVVHHFPLALVPVPPHHNIDPHDSLPVRNLLVEVADGHHRVPVSVPVELLRRRVRSGFGFRRGVRRGDGG